MMIMPNGKGESSFRVISDSGAKKKDVFSFDKNIMKRRLKEKA